ncbi:MAG: GNAT family N-acetyltransferase [Bacteroidales bacterium]|nr:GNAT family N-acetyltransferase [Bacteroidales bacterium]
MRIRQGRPQDARLIAEGIVMAITPETCLEAFGHPGITIEDVTEVFEALAARPRTQYSYLNTLVAEDEATGEPMGLIVSYDGAELHELREQFVKEAEERLGWKAPHPLPDETDASEVYIDTLAVLPQWRRRGVGKALLEEAAKLAERMRGKPAGLLVAKHNAKAERLYDSAGFRYVGDRDFFGESMRHLVRT